MNLQETATESAALSKRKTFSKWKLLKVCLYGGAIALLILGSLVAALFLVMAGAVSLVEFPFYLFFGWIVFLYETFSRISFNPAMIAGGAIVAVLLTVGTQAFLRWLYANYRVDSSTSGDVKRVWPWRWTLSGMTFFVMLYVTSISVSGLIGHGSWILRGRNIALATPLRLRMEVFSELSNDVLPDYYRKFQVYPVAKAWTPMREIDLKSAGKRDYMDRYGNPIHYLSDGKSYFLKSYGADGSPDIDPDDPDDLIYFQSVPLEKSSPSE